MVTSIKDFTLSGKDSELDKKKIAADVEAKDLKKNNKKKNLRKENDENFL